MRCEPCDREFMNSDEYLAHMQEHFLAKMDEYLSFFKAVSGQQGQEIDQAINKNLDILAQKIAEHLSPIQQSAVSQAAPLKRDYTFEAIQLTSIASSTGKTTDEVLSTYRELLDKLAKTIPDGRKLAKDVRE